MTWIVICVVLLAAFGPVFWLLPSRRDKRLSALRSRARTDGLVVELSHLPKLDAAAFERVSASGRVLTPVIECAAYSLVLKHKLQYLPTWRLLRFDGASNPPRPGWCFQDRAPAEAHIESMLAALDIILPRLPADVVGMEVTARSLVVYWLEGVGADEQTVSALAGLLGEFEGALAALEEAIEQKLNAEDS